MKRTWGQAGLLGQILLASSPFSLTLVLMCPMLLPLHPPPRLLLLPLLSNFSHFVAHFHFSPMFFLCPPCALRVLLGYCRGPDQSHGIECIEYGMARRVRQQRSFGACAFSGLYITTAIRRGFGKVSIIF